MRALSPFIYFFSHSHHTPNMTSYPSSSSISITRHRYNQSIMSLAILATAGIIGASYMALRKQGYTPLEKELLTLSDSRYLLDHTEMVTVRGHRLRVVNLPGKQPERPLLLFIHGLGGQASQWEEQLKYFCDYASRVVALDLLGCGSSEVVTDWKSYDTAELASDIEAVAKTLDTSKGIIAIGHSYGCLVSSILATRIQLKGLVMICCPRLHLDAKQKRGQKMLPFIPDWLIDRGRRADRKGGLHSQSVNRFLGEEADEETRRRQLRWNLMSRTSVWKRFMSRARIPSPEILSKISTNRVLIIGGSEDKMAPPSTMDIVQEHLQEAPTRLLIQGAGHMPMVTNTQQVNSAIQEFLFQ
ncbi:Alpha/Beta hydrolase protein [Zychaea mexicana]|uniref:Alpha/Beta hydrolase protein n=1 Tax=Zychaea mexicana TaxID=64656 RepID=UPI0022FDEC81|nr:Alpha/Beta hydrolase protein [Zychaea mexicana]KAI9499338.1 Alpha/Beta hydrolase protein [Zychaea mexicana]